MHHDHDWPRPDDAAALIESLLSDTQPIIGTYGPEEAHRRVIDVAERFRQRLVEQFTIEQAENAAEEYLSRARASGTKRFR